MYLILSVGAELQQASARTYSFISNKGGVGKTHIAVNLAIQLAREGRRVLLIDADLGSANTDIRLGIRPKISLLDFYQRRADIFECLTRSEYGFHFLAGSSGDFALANLGHQQKIRLLRAFDRLVRKGGYTDVFFDLGAGIGSRVLDFALVTDECIVVATPTDIVAAYASLKACWVRYLKLSEMNYFRTRPALVAHQTDGNGDSSTSGLRMNFIVNQASSLEEAKRVYFRILDVARTYFYTNKDRSALPIRYLGGIPYVHGLLREAERNKVPAMVLYPYHQFSKAIVNVSDMLLEKQHIAPNMLDMPFSDRVRGIVQTWVS